MANKISRLNKPRMNRVIVLEELNFVWDECELEEVASMVNQGDDFSKSVNILNVIQMKYCWHLST